MASEPNNIVAKHLLDRAHPPENAEAIYHEKVRQRPLLLRPTSPDPSLNARSKRQYEQLQKRKARRKENKVRPLSAKQKRAQCVYEIPKEQQRYAIYEPLHRMWCGYMGEILGLDEGKARVDGNGAGPMLTSADYHGALLEVVRSQCPSRVGLHGIVVKDNKFTFEMITKDDKLKLVPKEQTIFRFEVPYVDTQALVEQRRSLVFEIHGDHFRNRAPERATRKFRMHHNAKL